MRAARPERGAARDGRRTVAQGCGLAWQGGCASEFTLTEGRERHSRLAADPQREAELLIRRQGRALAPRRHRKARGDVVEQADRATRTAARPGGGCCSRWQLSAAELYGREHAVSLSELLAELDGEDLDRVLLRDRRGQAAPDHDPGFQTTSGYAPPSLIGRSTMAGVDRNARLPPWSSTPATGPHALGAGHPGRRQRRWG